VPHEHGAGFSVRDGKGALRIEPCDPFGLRVAFDSQVIYCKCARRADRRPTGGSSLYRAPGYCRAHP
jgi:hypothetical protein